VGDPQIQILPEDVQLAEFHISLYASFAEGPCTQNETPRRGKHRNRIGKLVASQGSLPEPLTAGALMDRICRLIICQDLPFSSIEWPEFRELVRFLRPGTRAVGRNSLKCAIDAQFVKEKSKVVNSFGLLSSKVSLTCDAWTSKNQQQFLAIMAHCIDNTWVMKKQLLDFRIIDGEHSGENLAAIMYEVLVDYKLNGKVLALTTYNASNNDTMMREMSRLSVHDGVQFQPEWSHIRCLAHAIHLVVMQILSPFKPPKKTQSVNCLQHRLGT